MDYNENLNPEIEENEVSVDNIPDNPPEVPTEPEVELPIAEAPEQPDNTVSQSTAQPVNTIPEVNKKANIKNTFALLSMILGIASLLICCCSMISIPCAIAAIVFGALGIKSDRRGMAIAGIVLGGMCVILSILILVGYIVYFILNSEGFFNAYPSPDYYSNW